MRNKPRWYSVLIVGLVFLLATLVGCCPTPPTIAFSPSSFTFNAQQGETNLLTDTLHISNSGNGTLDWSVSSDANWLTLAPTTGSSKEEEDKVTVSMDISGMDVGNYAASITICASRAPNSPQTIEVVLSITPEIPPQTLSVHFIDVGQGDAILIDYGSYEMLIDGGGKSPGVVAYLNDFVDEPLEVMVATHPHADHIGGLIGVLDDFEVDEIWFNGDTSTSKTYSQFMAAVNSEGDQVYEARRGDTIEVGDLVFDVLHPVNLSGTTNNNSIVLSLSYGQVDFLFTGDAEWEAEAGMLAEGIVPDVEILKVGHHGSRTASSSSFLAAARPEVAIYMAGVNNRYGHPHPETISALKAIGAQIYGTDVNGTVIVSTDGQVYILKTEK